MSCLLKHIWRHPEKTHTSRLDAMVTNDHDAVKCEDEAHQAPTIDKALERKLLWKLDLRVIPILWVLFLVAFFDRSNIGNAKIAGMTEALDMKGNDYNVAVTIFTVAYVVSGMPANLLVKKFGPRTLIVYMFCWGLSMFNLSFLALACADRD